MFVRFRKIPCGGFRPKAALYEATYRACQYPYGRNACRGHCPAHPRCRWLIGHDEKLSPYRLKVILVENKRVDGKVKQETIAVLGSIDATWLPEFWEGIDNADKLRCDDWELQSLRARTAFWETANPRLKKLANRLGPDLKRLRIAAHKRVPWPKELERKKLEVLEAKQEYDSALHGVDHNQKMIETEKRLIERAQEHLALSEKLARYEQTTGVAASAKLAKLSAELAKLSKGNT